MDQLYGAPFTLRVVLCKLETIQFAQAVPSFISAHPDSLFALGLWHLFRHIGRLSSQSLVRSESMSDDGGETIALRVPPKLYAGELGCVLRRLPGTALVIGTGNIEIAQYNVTEIMNRASIA